MREPKKEKCLCRQSNDAQIGKSSQQLQVALQRVEAPAGFADRVQARVAQNTAESVRLKRDCTGKRAIRSALCIAMIKLVCLAAERAQSHEVIRG
jgi:hypothetical protein